MTRQDWEYIQAVNATAAFLHCREAVKVMMPNTSGAIVNIASYASYFAFPTIAASKGALAQLTRTLALEVIDHGIRVNAVGVGDVMTNILNDVVEMAGSSWPRMVSPRRSGALPNRRKLPKSLCFWRPSEPASWSALWSWPTEE